LLQSIDAALAAIEQRPHLVALLVRSSERVFSAGADLKIVESRLGERGGAEAMRATSRLFHAVYDRLAALPVVTVAEIAGHALGGGCELALACDLRICDRAVQIGLPEAKVGLVPGAGGTQRLTKLCGAGTSARLILTGEIIDGLEAHRVGLVERAVERRELPAAIAEVLDRVKALSPEAVRQAKACLTHAVAISRHGAAAETRAIGLLIRAVDTQQRVQSFATQRRQS
jgi:enoyl-CoA hydratase